MTNGTDSTETAAVLAAEEARGAAIAAKDWDGLRAILADDYEYTHSTGRTENSEQWIANISKLGRKVERGDLAVRFYGDVALMHGPSQYRYDEPFDGDSHYGALIDVLQVWAKIDGKWRVAASHAVKNPK